MNLNELYALLIALIPIVLAVIFARRFNFIHGFITYVFTSYLLVFCLDAFGTKIPADIMTYLNPETGAGFGSGSVLLVGYFNNLIAKIPFLTKSLEGANGKYIYLAVYAVIFIICQIVASIIASHKRKEIRRLKRQSKRY